MKAKKQEPILRLLTINLPIKNRLNAMRVAEKLRPGYEAVTWRPGKKKTTDVLMQSRHEKPKKTKFKPKKPWRSATRKAINELRGKSREFMKDAPMGKYDGVGPWAMVAPDIDDDGTKKEVFRQAREDTKEKREAKNKLVRKQFNIEKEITRRVRRLQRLLLISIASRPRKRSWHRQLSLLAYPITASWGMKTQKAYFSQKIPHLPIKEVKVPTDLWAKSPEELARNKTNH